MLTATQDLTWNPYEGPAMSLLQGHYAPWALREEGLRALSPGASQLGGSVKEALLSNETPSIAY